MNKQSEYPFRTASRRKVEVKFIEDKDVNLLFKPLQLQSKEDKSKSVKSQNICENVKTEESEIPVQSKPSNLFEKGDVGGQQLFGFQTPKRQSALTNKVTFSPDVSKTPVHKRFQGEIIHSPKTSPKCYKSSAKRKNLSTKKNKPEQEGDNHLIDGSQTPYNLRKKLKSKIVAAQQSDESEDFSASESEYESDSSSGSSSSGSTSEEKADQDSPVKRTFISRHESSLPPNQRRNKLNFVPAAEDYFQSHASKRVLTSNHTLGRLRHQLPQEKLLKLLSKVSSGHDKFYKKLLDANETAYLFRKWKFLLSEGFNIILYGVGSKRNLLTYFHEQMSEPCVVINGFFPSITIQEVVSAIAEDILKINTTSLDLLEVVDHVKDAFSQKKSCHLYLVVHNIDGVMLRNSKSQEMLSSLSQAANIHLIASIDHVSSALMWDQHILSMYNFLWWDETTFQPYTEETAFESSLLVQQSGHLALSSLQSVFHSLTTNAKSIFILMAEYQKSHKKDGHYTGMPFKKLYSLCRESLLVSSDLALRSQLTEFLDHKLLKSRRGTDGSEILSIPIDSAILDQFLSQQAAI